MRVTGKRVSQPMGESGTFAEQPKYETGRFVLQSLNCLPCYAVVYSEACTDGKKSDFAAPIFLKPQEQQTC